MNLTLFSYISGLAKYALLGELDFSVENDDAQPVRFKIAERIKHPEYTSKLKYNDIALLRLEIEVIFNEYIRPACLPEFSTINFVATVTGWGQTGPTNPQSTHLLKTELSLFTYQDCNALYEVLNRRQLDKKIVHNTQICAGVRFRHEDTCHVNKRNKAQAYAVNFKFHLYL